MPAPTTPALVLGARCLELSGQIDTSLFWIPRGQVYPRQTLVPAQPNGQSPLAWTNKYAFAGIAIPHQSDYCFMDGMNEVGLTVAALWLPGAGYPQAATAPYVWFTDLAAYLLGNFASASDVYEALRSQVSVVGPPTPPPNGAPNGYIPLHFIVTDASGNSLVIECLDGSTMLYPPHAATIDTSDGVLTNAPPYLWQRQNLANYANLDVAGAQTSLTASGPPVGAGLTGMPGDPMSPSRFVRAATLSQALRKLPADGTGWLPAPNGKGSVQPAQALVNVAMQLVQVVMQTPYGTTLVQAANGSYAVGDWTMWAVVRDQTNLRYYFTTAFNGIMRSIDLTQLPVSATGRYQQISLLPDEYQDDWCLDVTADLQPATLD
jgi:choloylglycine hydrolase